MNTTDDEPTRDDVLMARLLNCLRRMRDAVDGIIDVVAEIDMTRMAERRRTEQQPEAKP